MHSTSVDDHRRLDAMSQITVNGPDPCRGSGRLLTRLQPMMSSGLVFLRLDSTSDFDYSPNTLAATLDTEPLAWSYSGGVHTRSSSNPFWFARARNCYPPVWSSGLQFAAAETPIEGGQRRRTQQISHTTAASRATGSSTIPVVSERFMEPDSSTGEIG